MTDETCEHNRTQWDKAEPAVNFAGGFWCEDCGADLTQDEDGSVMAVEQAAVERRIEAERKAARMLDPNDPWNTTAPLPGGLFPNEEPPF